MTTNPNRFLAKAGAAAFLAFYVCAATTAQAGSLEFTLTRTQQSLSVHMPLTGAGNWVFTITKVTGTVSQLGMQIRECDFGCGDTCWTSGMIRKPKAGQSFSAQNMPPSCADACGGSNPDPDDEFWVLASMTGGGSITIRVEFPDGVVGQCP